MKKHLIRLFVAATALSLTVVSCSMLQGLGDQIVGIANLANCQYSMKNFSNVSIAGVNLNNVKNGDISVTDLAKLTAAIVTKKVPLTMDVNVDVKNPTTTDAALTAMEYIMNIDGTQIATGTTNRNYTIRKSATTTVALPISTDIYHVCNNINSLKTFVQSFSGDGTSSRIGLSIKPSINVGGVSVPIPDYITVQKTTGGSTGNSGSGTRRTINMD